MSNTAKIKQQNEVIKNPRKSNLVNPVKKNPRKSAKSAGKPSEGEAILNSSF